MTSLQARRARRLWLPMGAICVFAAVVAGRLAWIQVLNHEAFSTEANDELSAKKDVFGHRGSILDRDGHVLSASIDTWDFWIRTSEWKKPEVALAASDEIAKALKLSAPDLRRQALEHGLGEFRVARDVDYETGFALIKSKPDGLIASPNTKRVNPDGDLALSVLGIINGDDHGSLGIEYALDRTLAGRPGSAIFERDSKGAPIPFGRIVTKEPTDGRDVVLSLDRYLQQLAERYLDDAVKQHRAKSGTILIMDPNTGGILALATLPRLSAETIARGGEGFARASRNVAVEDLYEPGSVMKVITAASAIDAGLVTANSGYVDTGSVKIFDTELKNWDDNVYGYQTMTGVLQHSINTGAVYMAQLLGKERFAEYLDRFGFGRQSGIEMSGESVPIFRRPKDKGWTPVDLATQSFGQAISVNAIQMATAFSAVVNGGNMLKPRLVDAYIDPDGTRHDVPVQVEGRAIKGETSATMREMLRQVVDPVGRTHPGKPREYTAGGKSGTANIPVTNGYNDRQIASFIGFAPFENPRVVIYIKLDDNADGLTGTAAAAPVFAKLADEVLRFLNVNPDVARVERR